MSTTRELLINAVSSGIHGDDKASMFTIAHCKNASQINVFSEVKININVTAIDKSTAKTINFVSQYDILEEEDKD